MRAYRGKIFHILMLSWCFYAIVYFSLIAIGYKSFPGFWVLLGELGLGVTGLTISFRRNLIFAGSSIKPMVVVFFVMAVTGDFFFNLMNIYPAIWSKWFYETPFLLFLVISNYFLMCMYMIGKPNAQLKKLYFFPIVAASIFIGAAFVFGLKWKIGYASPLGVYHILETLLEAVAFLVATFLLMVATRDWVRETATGFLVLIASDLVIRCGTVLGLPPSLHIAEPFWAMSYLFLIRGMLLLSDSSVGKGSFLDPERMKSYVSIFIFSVLLWGILLFSIMFYLSSNVDISRAFHQVNKMAPMMVVFVLLSVFVSQYLSKMITDPFKIIKKQVMGHESLEGDFFSYKVSNVSEIRDLECFILESLRFKENKHKTDKKRSEEMRRIAHDIRSPAFAIQAAISNIPNIPNRIASILKESVDMLEQSAQRMLDIDSGEIDDSCNNTHSDYMPLIIRNLIDEKKYLANVGVDINLLIEDPCLYTMSHLDSLTIYRIMSNLINNSIESIHEKGSKERGKVSVYVETHKGFVCVTIKDNGVGVPSKVKKKIFNRGVSTKLNGTGTGLSFIKESVESSGGWIFLDEILKEGASLIIGLPALFDEKGFLDKIDIRGYDAVCVVDDEDFVHMTWERRFKSLGVKMNSCKTPDDLRDYSRRKRFKNILYLVDYHLGGSEDDGLSLIEELHIENNAILVTSRCFEQDILDRADDLTVPIIPKKVIGMININYGRS